MKFLKILLLGVMFLTASLSSYALSEISYTNFARSDNGLFLDQPITVTITVLDGSTIKYKETHAVTTNSFGLFTVKVGAGTPSAPYNAGMYTDLVASNSLNVKAEYDGRFVALSSLLTTALKTEESSAAAIGTVNLNDAYINGNQIEVLAGFPVDLTGSGLIQSLASIADINTNGNKTLTTKQYVDDKVGAVLPLKTLTVNDGLVMTPGPSYNGTLNQVAGIADLGVTNAKIKDGAVTESKLGTQSVTNAIINNSTSFLEVSALGDGGTAGIGVGALSVTNGVKTLNFQGVGLTKVTRTDNTILIDGSDKWGSQVVVHDATLTGNGASVALGLALDHPNTWLASATQTFGTVDINGGAIDGTVIGANSAVNGTFATATATTFVGNLNKSISAGNGLVGGSFNNSADISFDVNTNTTLEIVADVVGINLSKDNSWIGVQSLPANAAQGNNLITAIEAGAPNTLDIDVIDLGGQGKLLTSNGTANSWTSLGTAGTSDITLNAYTAINALDLQIASGVVGNTEINDATKFVQVTGTGGPFFVSDGNQILNFAGNDVTSVTLNPATNTVNINSLVATEDPITGNGTSTGKIGLLHDATLQHAGVNGLGLNLDNDNIWTGKQTFEDIAINGGTIDASVIGAVTAASGTFTNVTVKDADGNTNFVIGSSTPENAGWAKLYTDAGKEIVILGTTGTSPNRAGAVSVTDANGWGTGLPVYGAGMFHDPASNNWMVGAGKYDLTMGAAFLSNASTTASVNVFNGGVSVFTADQSGKVTANQYVGALQYSISAGDGLSGTAFNNGAASTFAVNHDATLQIDATSKELGIDLDNDNIWTGKQTFEDIAINGGTINASVIGAVTAASGTFTNVTVKDADGNNNFVIGTSTVENAGWAKLYNDAGKELVILGTANGSGAVSVSDGVAAGAGIYNDGSNWVVGAGNNDKSMGAAFLSNSSTTASVNVFNGGVSVFTADQAGKVTANQYVGALQYSVTAGDGLSGTAFNNGAASTFAVNHDATLQIDATSKELGLDLDNENTWTAVQTFNAVSGPSLLVQGDATYIDPALIVADGNVEVGGDVTATTFIGALQYSVSAGDGLSGTAFNNGAASTFAVKHDGTLQIDATSKELGINLDNDNIWTGKQTFEDIAINGGTIDASVIGAVTAANGTFTKLTVKCADGIDNFVIGTSTVENAGWAKLYNDAGKELVILGTANGSGAVSVSDGIAAGAGMYNDGSNWVVGAGNNDKSMGAAFLSNASTTASVNVFNGGVSVFTADQSGKVTANQYVGALQYSVSAGDGLSGTAFNNGAASTFAVNHDATLQIDATSKELGLDLDNENMWTVTQFFDGTDLGPDPALWVTNGNLQVDGDVTATTYIGALQYSVSAGDGLSGTAFNNGAASTFAVNHDGTLQIDATSKELGLDLDNDNVWTGKQTFEDIAITGGTINAAIIGDVTAENGTFDLVTVKDADGHSNFVIGTSTVENAGWAKLYNDAGQELVILGTANGSGAVSVSDGVVVGAGIYNDGSNWVVGAGNNDKSMGAAFLSNSSTTASVNVFNGGVSVFTADQAGKVTANQYVGALQYSVSAGDGLSGTAFNNGAASTFAVNHDGTLQIDATSKELGIDLDNDNIWTGKQTFEDIAITGGTIDASVIGGTIPANGTFDLVTIKDADGHSNFEIGTSSFEEAGWAKLYNDAGQELVILGTSGGAGAVSVTDGGTGFGAGMYKNAGNWMVGAGMYDNSIAAAFLSNASSTASVVVYNNTLFPSDGIAFSADQAGDVTAKGTITANAFKGGFTANSILFSDAAGVITQDATELTYVEGPDLLTTPNLKVTTDAEVGGKLDVTGDVTLKGTGSKYVGALQYSVTAGDGLSGTAFNNGAASTFAVKHDGTLQIDATSKELGINLDNDNIWTGKQTFEDIAITGGTIDGTVIGGTTAAAGTFTNLTVKDAGGLTNFVIGSSTTENAGWAKLFTDAQKEIVVLGTTTDGTTKAGAVSVTDEAGWNNSTNLPNYGAGMFHDPTSNNWMVGTGKYDQTLGATLLSNSSSTASVTIFNSAVSSLPNHVVFNADQNGDVYAKGTITAGKIVNNTYTTGSVLFAGADKSISENNSSLFWDNTKHYLGLNNSSPEAVLDVKYSNAGDGTHFSDMLMTITGVELSAPGTYTAPEVDPATQPDVFLANAEILIAGQGNLPGIEVDGGAGILTSNGAVLKSNLGIADPGITNAAIIGIAADADYAGYFAGFAGTSKTAAEIKTQTRDNLYITKEYLQDYVFDASEIQWKGLSIFNNLSGPAIQAVSSDAIAPTVSIENKNAEGVALQLTGASAATTALEITTGNISIGNGHLVVSSSSGTTSTDGNTGPSVTIDNAGNGVSGSGYENGGGLQIATGHFAMSYIAFDMTTGLADADVPNARIDQVYSVYDIKSKGNNAFTFPVDAVTGGNPGTIIYIINSGTGAANNVVMPDTHVIASGATAAYILTQTGAWVRLN